MVALVGRCHSAQLAAGRLHYRIGRAPRVKLRDDLGRVGAPPPPPPLQTLVASSCTWVQ